MKIAAQMYSVRNFIAENGYGTALKSLAEIGFSSVEHACGFGEFDGKPAELRQFMDDLGITMMGTHLGAQLVFDPAQRTQTAELYATLGAKYLICPVDGLFYDCDGCAEFAEKSAEAAEFLKSYGMFFGYHCHMYEFLIHPQSGKTYWDFFAESTPDTVVLEQDCGWSCMAGQDPAALIRKYPNRNQALHFKPSIRPSHRDKKVFLGEDSVNWQEVIAAAREAGSTEYCVIEQERYAAGMSDMQTIAVSFENLRKML